MKEIILTKQDVYKIIEEEAFRFSEKLENDSIVNNFAAQFARVFAEALNKTPEDSAYKEMYKFIQKFRKVIIESTEDPFALSKKDQAFILRDFSDRNILSLIPKTLDESRKEKTIILEGNLFFGKESAEIRLAEYKNREVVLDTVYLGSKKKYKIYVENNGIVEKIEFGEKDFTIKKTSPTSKYPQIWVCKNWTLNEYITQSGDEWIVKSESGEVLGTHKSKEEAEAQLQAIHTSQHKEGACNE